MDISRYFSGTCSEGFLLFLFSFLGLSWGSGVTGLFAGAFSFRGALIASSPCPWRKGERMMCCGAGKCVSRSRGVTVALMRCRSLIASKNNFPKNQISNQQAVLDCTLARHRIRKIAPAEATRLNKAQSIAQRCMFFSSCTCATTFCSHSHCWCTRTVRLVRKKTFQFFLQ